jgi:hypothetical protein
MPAGLAGMRKVIEVASGRIRYSAHEKTILLEEKLSSPLPGIGLTLRFLSFLALPVRRHRQRRIDRIAKYYALVADEWVDFV